MFSQGPFAQWGLVGDSLFTGNEGFGGAVPLWPPLASQVVSLFTGTTPAIAPGVIQGVNPSWLSTFNRGSPTWVIVAEDGASIQTVRTLLPQLPSSTTVVLFEGGTNDITDSIDPSSSDSNLIGAMTDAIALFPLLQAFFYIGVACIGERYQTVGGVSSFAGNVLLGGAVDAVTDSLMATLFASVNAQTGTNSLGVPIQFIPIDMRTTAVQQLAASGNPPPWANSGYLTVDGRHPKAGGLDVALRTAMLANITVAP